MPKTYTGEQEDAVAVASRPRLKRPPLYKVILHNDDFTTMDFVIFVLQTVFARTETEAVSIMLAVHTEGSGVAGIYTFEIADTKAAKVIEHAQTHEYPLLCTVEEE